jgi:AraC-like DNA-binding protein
MELINRLMKLVEDERLFLNPELSLTEVAARLNTNTTYLSRAVNDILKKNFPAYINEKRICEAQKMLADPDYANRSIEGIARMAGFKSKSAFNEAFKRFTGMTPSFFQRSALKL